MIIPAATANSGLYAKEKLKKDNEKKPVKRVSATPQQEEILSSGSGIKRIIACAGSGKTFVLTQSIIDVLEKNLCGPEEVLAITFTKNAAENMRHRIKEKLNKKVDFNALNIYTFNSFGNLIISENSFLMGLGSDYRLINISRSWQILYSIVKQANFKNIASGKETGRFLNELLRYINDLKCNLISARELKNYNNSRLEIISGFSSSALCRQELEILEYQQDLAAVYEKYEEIKDNSNLVDYHDHVFKPYMLLLQNKNVRSKYRKRYKYIFIDEFQDTDVAQAYLVSMIFDPAYSNLTVVGDDDQGIYSFRGACVENILGFHKWECFINQEVKNFRLTTNFRSGANIVNSIGGVIACNSHRFEKELKPESADKHSEVFFSCYSCRESESESIANNIKLLISNGFKLKDIAVISRRKNFRSITEAFERNSLRYEQVSSRGFFYEPEILFLVSWLMLIQDILNEYHLIYILQSGKYQISDRDIFFLRNTRPAGNAKTPGKEKDAYYGEYNKNSKNYLIDALFNYKNNKNISAKCAERVSAFISELDFYISQAPLLSLGALVNLVFENSGLADELRAGFDKTAKQKIKNIETLIKLSADFDLQRSGSSLESFMLYLKDVAKTEEEDPETLEFSNSNSIKIMSIHAAKGLEFKIVFMPGLLKNDYLGKTASRKFKMPSLLRKDKGIYRDIKKFTSLKAFNQELKNLNTEEERRVFYVGCSRAGVYLFLSAVESETSANKVNAALPFLKEMVLNGNVLPLNPEGASYLKNNFNYRANTFFKSLENYLGNMQKPGNLKGVAVTNTTVDKNDLYPHSVKTAYYENILALITDAISPGSLEINSKINALRETGNSIYMDFIKNFGSLPWKTKQYMKNIKKSLRHGDYASAARRVNLKNNFALTELLLYIKCPAYYKWRYLYNIPEPQNDSAAVGLEAHRHIQALTSIRYKEKLSAGLINSKNITAEEYLGILQNADGKENIYNLVLNFYKSSIFELNDVSEIMLEQLFYWNLNGYIINCKADRLDRVGRSNFRIIDYKASDSRHSSGTGAYVDQLKAYTCGIMGIFGAEPENIISCLFYLKDAATVWKYFSENELSLFKNSIIEAVKKIRKYKFETVLKQSCKKDCCYFSLCSMEL